MRTIYINICFRTPLGSPPRATIQTNQSTSGHFTRSSMFVRSEMDSPSGDGNIDTSHHCHSEVKPPNGNYHSTIQTRRSRNIFSYHGQTTDIRTPKICSSDISRKQPTAWLLSKQPYASTVARTPQRQPDQHRTPRRSLRSPSRERQQRPTRQTLTKHPRRRKQHFSTLVF